MIELSGVSFSYPDGTKALSEINLVIDEGEFVVVCGPTGCGKSTLLMTVNGLIPHTVSGEYQGEARVAGRVVRDVSVAGLAAHVGTVFQNPEAQIFSLTCEDEIAFGLENLSLSPREIDKRINHVLHLLSLDSLRRRRTAELSGGEKQKLVIAATLAMGPRVLVLDEPLSDLDPEGKITVLNTIARLNREGMTIVMAEHNLDLVLQDATRMLVMEKGRVVFDGDPCSILARCRSELASMGVRLPQEEGTGPEWAHGKRGFPPLRLPQAEGAGAVNSSPFKNSFFEQGARVNPVLKAEGLGHTYAGGIVALRDVDFSLDEGIVCIVGGNGAGKSTLARILVGLIKPSKGDVFLQGMSIRKLGLKKLSLKCGFLFQNPDLQLLFDSVEQELFSCLPGFRDRGKRVSEVLERLNLQDYRKRHPQSLSRGERQRLALATVLLRSVDLLILDEPTTGQDWKHISLMMEIAEERSKKGALVLLITHDMRLVAEHAEKVLLLQGGNLRETENWVGNCRTGFPQGNQI
jgi:energy-coupling factor transporter ATP-binding protein EcfA2